MDRIARWGPWQLDERHDAARAAMNGSILTRSKPMHARSESNQVDR
jgi:hypothetical protein